MGLHLNFTWKNRSKIELKTMLESLNIGPGRGLFECIHTLPITITNSNEIALLFLTRQRTKKQRNKETEDIIWYHWYHLVPKMSNVF